MAKIKVEIEVPDGEYCDGDDTCSLLEKGCFGQYWCSLYGDELDIDRIDTWEYRCKRCSKCKQAEVKDANSKGTY